MPGGPGAPAAACDVRRVLRGDASLRAPCERMCAAPRVTEPQLQLTRPAAELLLRRAVLDARRVSELFSRYIEIPRQLCQLYSFATAC